MSFYAMASTSAASAVEISNTANASQDADATVFTFSGLSLGAAVTGRLIAVTVHFRHTTDTMSSATIGGVSATLETVSASGNYSVQIAWAAVPTGATGDVVITGSATLRNCAVSVYRIVGQSSNTPAVVAIANGTNIHSPLVDFTGAPSNGVAIYGFIGDSTAENPGTWTNSLTENVDADMESEAISSAHFGPGAVPDSAFQRTSNPGVDEWNAAAVAGAAWS